MGVWQRNGRTERIFDFIYFNFFFFFFFFFLGGGESLVEKEGKGEEKMGKKKNKINLFYFFDKE